MGKKEKGRSRKKKPFPVKTVAAVGTVLAVAVGIGAGCYIYKGMQYETVFFPSTRINGIDASDRTVEQMKELISREADAYVLNIKHRGGEPEQITGKDIGMYSVFDGKLEEYLAAQKPMEWWSRQKETRDYRIETMIEFDQARLDEEIEKLELFDEDNMELAPDAYLSDYVPGQGYVVMPEGSGTILDKEKTAQGIRDAVKGLEKEVDLEQLDVYEPAAVTSDDPELNRLASKLNQFANMQVIYTFGEKEEILDGSYISKWMNMDENEEITIDQEAVTAYVKDLAAKYDTASQKKVLKTSYGDTVEIAEGFYGWKIDQEAEAKELYEILAAGTGDTHTREPVYKQTAASHGEHDYGDTYVEINLTSQHLFFYKEGQLLVESDFVSGNVARGNSTPAGAYPLTYKQRNTVLRGPGYASPVSYWMPFNRNIGMHDASWRGSFGGNIYKTNGSHGCINLPRAAAKTIYENIEKGMPVLCYKMEGTEPVKKSSGSKSKGSSSPAPAPAPAVQKTAAPAAGEAESTAAEGAGGESSAETTAAEEPAKRRQPWEYGPGVETTGQTEETQETQGQTSDGGQPETAAPGGDAQQSAGEGQQTGPAGPGQGGGESQEVGPGV